MYLILHAKVGVGAVLQHTFQFLHAIITCTDVYEGYHALWSSVGSNLCLNFRTCRYTARQGASHIESSLIDPPDTFRPRP
jgi:hypothetical protein